MDAAAPAPQKDWPVVFIRTWYLVSSISPPFFFITQFFFFFQSMKYLTTPLPTFFIFSVCIISAIRIRMIQSASRGDFAEALPYSHIWSFLEPTIAICTSCLPMARPVFGKYLPSLLHRSKSSETSEHQLVRNRAWLMWWKFLLWEKKSGVLFYDERFFLLVGQRTGKEDYEMEHYPGVLLTRFDRYIPYINMRVADVGIPGAL